MKIYQIILNFAFLFSSGAHAIVPVFECKNSDTGKYCMRENTEIGRCNWKANEALPSCSPIQSKDLIIVESSMSDFQKIKCTTDYFVPTGLQDLLVVRVVENDFSSDYIFSYRAEGAISLFYKNGGKVANTLITRDANTQALKSIALKGDNGQLVEAELQQDKNDFSRYEATVNVYENGILDKYFPKKFECLVDSSND